MALTVADYWEDFAALLNPSVGLDTMRRMGVVYWRVLWMCRVFQGLGLGPALTLNEATRYMTLPLMGNLPGLTLDAIVSFDENASFNVGTALLRGDLSVQTGRRLGDSGPTIGSHTPPETAIFIRRGELEMVMANFCASLVVVYLMGLSLHDRAAELNIPPINYRSLISDQGRIGHNQNFNGRGVLVL